MPELPERPSYYRYAFANLYNLSLLGGAAVAAAATNDWAVAAIAGGLEALWLGIGADTAPFRRWVDRQHRNKLAAAAKERRRLRILALPDQRDRERAIDLIEAHILMGKELAKNEHWTAELVGDEYSRLDSLLDAFVELAEAAARFDRYLQQFDPNKLRKDIARQKQLASVPGGDPETTALATRNADLLEKRAGTLSELGRLVQRTRAQMSVIENTFSLLRDQIVSLEPPKDIKGQLDEIVAGVDAVRAVLADGDRGLASTGVAPPLEESPPAPNPRQRVR